MIIVKNLKFLLTLLLTEYYYWFMKFSYNNKIVEENKYFILTVLQRADDLLKIGVQ